MALKSIDPQLVAAAQSGQRDAIEKLLHAVLPDIRRLIHRTIGVDSEIDDIAQRTLIEITRALPSFAGRSQFRSWVFSITIRCTWAYVKTRRQWLNNAQSLSMPPAVTRADEGASIHLLHKHLDQLGSAVRMVWALHDVEGYTTSEIAELLSLPAGTVSTRLRSAREKLRTQLHNDQVASRPIVQLKSIRGVS